MENEVFQFESNDFKELSCEIPVEVHQLPFGYSSGVLYLQFEKKSLSHLPSVNEKAGSLLPVLFLLFVIVFHSRAFLFWYLLPVFEESGLNVSVMFNLLSPEVPEIWFFWLFLCFSGTLIWSTILTIQTPPGEVSQDFALESEILRNNICQVCISEKMLEKIQKLGNNERKRTMFPRFCRTCSKIKPDRSHHCSVCNQCVLRMDHHCPYVSNCIGMMNYKYFINMIISGTASSLLISATMWKSVVEICESKNFELEFQVLVGISYLSNLVLSIFLVVFCGFHFYLIAQGLTTIEFREKMTVKFDESPYDKGCLQNFLNVFGRNPLIWFVPISKDFLGNGQGIQLTFEKNDG
jgi:hypothetical protein